VVGERFMDEGTMLAPNSSIVSILDIGTVTAVIHVIERDYPKLRIGHQAVVVTDAFPDRSFPARIVRIAPLLRETSREARVELEVPNSGYVLKPGMFVRVQIEFEKHEHAVVVPLTALAKRNGQQGVFVADRQELKAHFVPVTLGIVNNEAAEVVKPPLTGWVVTLGQHLLEDGATIILPKTEPGRSPATTGESPPKKSGKPKQEGKP
jgi:RND family efflux transporter MFP subunit